jgi:hypothetical protein
MASAASAEQSRAGAGAQSRCVCSPFSSVVAGPWRLEDVELVVVRVVEHRLDVQLVCEERRGEVERRGEEGEYACALE